MYKDITADDKRGIRDAVYARLEEREVAVGDDPNKRLIGSAIIYMFGATDANKSELGSGLGHDWYAPLDDFPGGIARASIRVHGESLDKEAMVPDDFMLLTTYHFESRGVYTTMSAFERRQLRIVVEVLTEQYPHSVDLSRVNEVARAINQWDD